MVGEDDNGSKIWRRCFLRKKVSEGEVDLSSEEFKPG
jgi:hypothetical protein